MKNRENNKNIFDEIDKDTETFKTAIKVSRHKRMLKKQIKILKGLTIIMFILSVTLICLGLFKGHKVSISIGIIGSISAFYGSVCLKIMSKRQTKKGEKR